MKGQCFTVQSKAYDLALRYRKRTRISHRHILNLKRRAHRAERHFARRECRKAQDGIKNTFTHFSLRAIRESNERYQTLIHGFQPAGY